MWVRCRRREGYGDMVIAYVLIGLVIVALVGLITSVRILKQYERGVQFRLGRVKGGARGPGLILIAPFIDHVHRVSLHPRAHRSGARRVARRSRASSSPMRLSKDARIGRSLSTRPSTTR